jgi:hypothetical protein
MYIFQERDKCAQTKNTNIEITQPNPGCSLSHNQFVIDCVHTKTGTLLKILSTLCRQLPTFLAPVQTPIMYFMRSLHKYGLGTVVVAAFDIVVSTIYNEKL